MSTQRFATPHRCVPHLIDQLGVEQRRISFSHRMKSQGDRCIRTNGEVAIETPILQIRPNFWNYRNRFAMGRNDLKIPTIKKGY